MRKVWPSLINILHQHQLTHKSTYTYEMNIGKGQKIVLKIREMQHYCNKKGIKIIKVNFPQFLRMPQAIKHT